MSSSAAIGQAAEWLVWTHLTLNSPLHVFLPLWDMGIDGLVHLPGTDIATAVQVKSRHVLDDGKLHLLVRDHELRDPRVMIVAVVLDTAVAQLRDTAICIDVATYRRLAFRREGSAATRQASPSRLRQTADGTTTPFLSPASPSASAPRCRQRLCAPVRDQ